MGSIKSSGDWSIVVILVSGSPAQKPFLSCQRGFIRKMRLDLELDKSSVSTKFVLYLQIFKHSILLCNKDKIRRLPIITRILPLNAALRLPIIKVGKELTV